MLLSELFTELSFIEFANISIGTEGGGKLKEGSEARFVTSTNEALLELYKRFLLSEKGLYLRTVEWKTHYPLRRQHALTSEVETPGIPKYIIDTKAEPFTGDLIHITGVRNSLNCELPINDGNDCNSVFTPSVDVLQIIHTSELQTYFVSYRAAHPTLIYSADNLADTMNQEILVPLALKTALRQKIAANLFIAMSGQEFSAQAQAFEMKFEQACAEVHEENLVAPREFSSNRKLEARGFR